MPDNKIIQSPVIFGEVLFDCFPDGQNILGGAPFNVAWHLTGFGANPRFISRIGKDNAGDSIARLMQQWHMDAGLVQRDENHPTGTVKITLNHGQPSFEIVPEQAYDYIEYAPIKNAIATHTPPLLYCGSLIRRSDTSRHTLEQLISNKIPLFVDINLRSPWWKKQDALELLSKARWVKLNNDELALLTDTKINNNTIDEVADKFRQQHNIELLIVTLGADGAIIVVDKQQHKSPTPEVSQLVDTVGAGDAFSSVIVTGILQQWPVDIMLERALHFAALICAQHGATAINHDMYEQLKTKWKLDVSKNR
ncbi:MAG TPA: carbohydrate kinase [Gammaproteobacteria bacterium]